MRFSSDPVRKNTANHHVHTHTRHNHTSFGAFCAERMVIRFFCRGTLLWLHRESYET